MTHAPRHAKETARAVTIAMNHSMQTLPTRRWKGGIDSLQRRAGAIAHGYRAHAMVAAHSLVVAGFGRDDLYRLL